MLSGDKKKDILTLKITIAKEAVSAVEYFILEEGSLGCSEESEKETYLKNNGSGVASLTGYWLPYSRHTKTHIINAAPDPVKLEKRAKQFINQLYLYGLNPGNATVSTSFIKQEDWSKSWKAHFKPIKTGRLLVTPSWIKSPQIDLIAANLTTQTILENLPAITDVLKGDGVFIGSGIPEERKEEIKQAISLLPLTPKEIRGKDGWIALAATKHKI